MTVDEVLRELEARGSEQTRKTYRRHGVTERLFGVSYGDLGQLKKRLKVNQPLALELWASGYHEARLLATMIADPAQTDEALLDAWVHEQRHYPITDAFAELAVRAPEARALLERWTASEEEWVGRTGWLMLARLAGSDSSLPDEYFEPFLATIELNIHSAPNRTRDAMNTALIAIGIRSARLEQPALEVAARIGTVIVDHGDTACKTPEASAYIRKTLARKSEKEKARAMAG